MADWSRHIHGCLTVDRFQKNVLMSVLRTYSLVVVIHLNKCNSNEISRNNIDFIPVHILERHE